MLVHGEQEFLHRPARHERQLSVLGDVLDGTGSEKTVTAAILRTIGTIVLPEQLENLLDMADLRLVHWPSVRILAGGLAFYNDVYG